jgi:hypothetical protein
MLNHLLVPLTVKKMNLRVIKDLLRLKRLKRVTAISMRQPLVKELMKLLIIFLKLRLKMLKAKTWRA